MSSQSCQSAAPRRVLLFRNPKAGARSSLQPVNRLEALLRERSVGGDSGIAEVLEARLNDYGIYTFKQIMEWDADAIEEFSRLLAFKDRIERDEWINQARFFYNQKQKKRSVAA